MLARKRRMFVAEPDTNEGLVGNFAVYPAKPVKGEVDFDELRDRVTKQISTALRYLAK